MEFTTAKAAIELLNMARLAVQNMRERVQASKDSALKESFGNLQDTFSGLREAILRLTEENDELRRAQTEKPPKPEIRQVGDTNYYFDGEKGPYCQPCYEREKKLVPLTSRQEYAGGAGRRCQACKEVFFEVHFRSAAPQTHSGPDGWMR